MEMRSDRPKGCVRVPVLLGALAYWSELISKVHIKRTIYVYRLCILSCNEVKIPTYAHVLARHKSVVKCQSHPNMPTQTVRIK